MTLPPAPLAPVSPTGVALGAYRGHTGPVDWRPLRGWFYRLTHGKRWHYVSVATPDCLAAFAIIDAGWATSAFAYVFDRRARRLLVDASKTGLPRAARVAAAAGDGAVSTFRAPGLSLRLEHVTGARQWRALATGKDGLEIAATLDETPATATLCAIAPIAGAVANCTHKTSCLAARGHAAAGGRAFALDGGFAAFDHTSGLLARETAWRWASASGARLGVNLVEGFNGPVENAAWIDGELRPLPAVSFHFRRDAPLEPWRITSAGGEVDLTFEPEGARAEDKNLVVAMSRYIQPIGVFHGALLGERVELCGVTEDHQARW